jgi:hypothetical protein
MPPPGKPGIRNTLPFVGPDGQIFQPPHNEPPGNPLNDEIASLRGRLSQAELDIRELRNVQFIDEPARTRITTLEGQMATLYPSHTHDYSTLTGIPSSFTPSTHNHDSAYSGAGHNHDSSYSGTSHTHAYSSLTSIPTSFTPSNHGNTAHIPDFAADSNYLGLQNAFNSHTHSYHDDWNGSGGFTTRTTSGPTPTW